jgi:hypothetical protein
MRSSTAGEVTPSYNINQSSIASCLTAIKALLSLQLMPSKGAKMMTRYASQVLKDSTFKQAMKR